MRECLVLCSSITAVQELGHPVVGLALVRRCSQHMMVKCYLMLLPLNIIIAVIIMIKYMLVQYVDLKKTASELASRTSMILSEIFPLTILGLQKNVSSFLKIRTGTVYKGWHFVYFLTKENKLTNVRDTDALIQQEKC